MVQADRNGTAAEQSPSEDRPRARKPARRQRTAGGRKGAFLVRVTDEEEHELKGRAAAVGVSVPRLMVESALAGSAQTVSERRALVAEFSGAIRLLGAVSNNVNQLARAYNASGQVPAELSATLHAATRVIARLDAAVEQFGGRR